MNYTKVFILVNYLRGVTWCNILLEPKWRDLNVRDDEKRLRDPINDLNSNKSFFGVKGLIN